MKRGKNYITVINDDAVFLKFYCQRPLLTSVDLVLRPSVLVRIHSHDTFGTQENVFRSWLSKASVQSFVEPRERLRSISLHSPAFDLCKNLCLLLHLVPPHSFVILIINQDNKLVNIFIYFNEHYFESILSPIWGPMELKKAPVGDPRYLHVLNGLPG
ncbi:hypothetical protein J2T17_007481 [Paenibacillus mucilaginosus]